MVLALLDYGPWMLSGNFIFDIVIQNYDSVGHEGEFLSLNLLTTR